MNPVSPGPFATRREIDGTVGVAASTRGIARVSGAPAWLRADPPHILGLAGPVGAGSGVTAGELPGSLTGISSGWSPGASGGTVVGVSGPGPGLGGTGS